MEPKGLPNIGSTCYMNSILQCLIHTPQFKQMLKELMLGEMDCNCLPVSVSTDKKVTYSLLQIVKEVQEHNRKWWSFCFGNNVSKSKVRKFLQTIRKRNSQFEGNDPQDSFEMFNSIISGIEDESLTSEGLDTQLTKNEQLMDACPVSRLFSGMYITVFKYDSCKHVETTFQRFTSICIPVIRQSNKQFRIEMGLEELTKAEMFSEADIGCRTCETPVTLGRSSKELSVLLPPPILVLQINRFEQSGNSGQLEKIQTSVGYPELLDLTPFVSKAFEGCMKGERQIQYSLYGVICHDGPITGGHYYALIRTSAKDSELTKFLKGDWSNPERMPKRINDFLFKNESMDSREIPEHNANTVKRLYPNLDDGGNHVRIDIPPQPNEYEMSCTWDKVDVWYYISDKIVKQIESPIGDHCAYILMYERKQ